MGTVRSGVLTICLVAGLGWSPAGAAGTPPKAGKLGPELYLAIGKRDEAGVRALLARGADPNARNALNFTPLMYAAASGQLEVVRRLIAAGAQVNAGSPFGTALTFAGFSGSTPVARYLLSRKADPNPQRPDRITVLMLAARVGDLEMAGLLLDRKVDVNARDNGGETALTYAARFGQTEAARLLLARGAAVDAADNHGWTPLAHAAANGHAACVRLLLGKGADPNAQAKDGRTPLLLAAACGDRPEVLGALLEGGARIEAEDAKQRTALTLAAARGYEESARLLKERGARPARTVPERTPGEAIAASLPLLQNSMAVFAKRTGCVSCHHEGVALAATGFARKRGFAIDMPLNRERLKRVLGSMEGPRPAHAKAIRNPEAIREVPLVDIGEATPGYAFLFAGLAAHEQPAAPALADAAVVLGRLQNVDGSWRFNLPREPMQSSFFTMTALVVQALKTYAPRERTAEAERRVARAREWMLTARAATMEDLAFRLLGLKWAGATPEERRKAIEELIAAQRPDGGWGQQPGMASDAYATGQALFALSQGGEMSAADPVYQRGVRLLLRTQEDDGSWYVHKRAIPANNYFDTGFPHGQSQYASHAATCWATMALMAAADPPAPVRQAEANPGGESACTAGVSDGSR